MKRYREIVIASSTHDVHSLARYIELFAEHSTDWECSPEKSSIYEIELGCPSGCIVTNHDSLPSAAMHFTMKGARSLYVTNIVPLSIGELDMDQYNAIGQAFANSIRKYSKTNAHDIRVELSKAEVKLDDIVTGKICKKLLKAYLGMYPLSYHPLDIQRLDLFTCALFRFSRKRFDLDAFQALLIEELRWSTKDAQWCRTRIEVGLEVLTANKDF